MNNRKYGKRILSFFMSLLILFSFITPAFAQTENEAVLGKVSGITQGLISEADGNNVTASIEETITLDFSPKNESIGRYMDAWWVGLKVEAPESLTVDEVKAVQYYNGTPSNWGNAKSFWQFKDSADDAQVHFLTFWLPVTLEYIDMFKAAG
ncbi:MAG: hypothetical protein ACI4GC_07810, partial [Acutalibacteraceae bacterium]